MAQRKSACIQDTKGLLPKCHSIWGRSTSQYEQNTKRFLTLLSAVLVKACSLWGPLFFWVIQGSHLLCWGRLWFRPSIPTSGGKLDKKWPIICTVVALISQSDVISTKSNLSLLDLSLSACRAGCRGRTMCPYSIYSHAGMTYDM